MPRPPDLGAAWQGIDEFEAEHPPMLAEGESDRVGSWPVGNMSVSPNRGVLHKLAVGYAACLRSDIERWLNGAG
jgi:hypothetical protein